jgi:hypothetical protein
MPSGRARVEQRLFWAVAGVYTCVFVGMLVWFDLSREQ